MSGIVLIYPYFRTHARNEMLFHPLGIAQLTALLRREGVDTSVVDCTFRQRDDVLDEVEEADPRIVGIYVMVSMSENARRFASELRHRLPDGLLVCGGPLPTLTPERFCRDFDLVFRGEAVGSFPRFCADYIKASALKNALTDVCQYAPAYPGLYGRCKEADSPVQSRPQSSSELTLNSLPIPDRSDYDHASRSPPS
jgi:anaerobic magnesium-protoporphyrin IX monomethyl ester cyclase